MPHSILFARDQLLRMEELAIGASANFVHHLRCSRRTSINGSTYHRLVLPIGLGSFGSKDFLGERKECQWHFAPKMLFQVFFVDACRNDSSSCRTPKTTRLLPRADAVHFCLGLLHVKKQCHENTPEGMCCMVV
jgi:hypothetical protein